MILERIEVRDFRSHRRTRVDFEEGISVIIGDNGSGKTSILDAINFALFKQKPNKDINVDDLIRRGAEETKVAVTFHSNGRVYRVVRGRKKGKALGSALYEIKEGEEILRVKGEDEITKEIEEILRVNGELFTSAIYIKQGEIDSLISAAPAVRKEHVGKLLGAEDLERAHQRMGEIIKEYRIRVEGFRNIPEDIKAKEEAMEGERKEVSGLRKELKTVVEKLEEKRGEFRGSEERIKRLEKIEKLQSEKKLNEAGIRHMEDNLKKIEAAERDLKETEDIHKRFIRLEEEIETLKGKRSKLARLAEREAQLGKESEKLKGKIKELDASLSRAFEEYTSILETRIESLDQLESACSRRLKEAERRKKEMEERRDKALSVINTLKGQNREIERTIQGLKEVRDSCPVCGKPLSKEHKKELLEEYSAKVKENLEEISKGGAMLKKIEEEMEGIKGLLEKLKGVNIALLRSRMQERTEAVRRVEEIGGEMEENKKLLKGLEDLEENISKKEEERDELREGQEKYISAQRFLRENLPEKERLQEKIKFSLKRIEEIEGEIKDLVKALGYEPELEELWDLRERHKRLWDELTAIEKEKTEKESIMSEKNRRVDALQKEIMELKEKEREGKKLVEFLIFLEKIRHLFHKDSLQRDLRVKSKPLVERYSREVFDRFNLPYSDLALTEDFNILLYSPHGEESVDMLSGGEKIAAALALRIGIAKALSGPAMELIILDEPTIHLDAQRRQELVEIIKRLTSIPQTIVVTHDKEFENAADRLILVEKTEGISQVRYEG